MRQADLDSIESGERQLEPWEIEQMCRESDEDGCLVLTLIIVFIVGCVVGFVIKKWIGV